MLAANLKRLVQTIGDFPTLPSVVARVIQELNNPYSSASDLNEIIAVDSAMTFKLLKMANSAYYGFPRAVTAVTEAIVLLGFSTVRNLLLTTMMYQFNEMKISGKNKSRRAGGYDRVEEWKHTVATAIAARELLHLRVHEALESLGYLAGLMHDIGRTFFIHYMPEAYEEVTRGIHQRDGMALSRREERLLGAHHGQVGAWIIDRWNLPREIVEPVIYHHYPDQAVEQRELTRALHNADHVAHLWRQPPDVQARRLAHKPYGVVGMDLRSEQVRGVLDTVQREMQQVETFIAL